jgi:hypothetical protein
LKRQFVFVQKKQFLKKIFADITEGQLVTEGYYPEVESNKFFLPPSDGKIFIVQVTKRDRPDIEIQVYPKVVSTIDSAPSGEVAKILNDIYKGKTPERSVAKLVASKDPKSRNEALQIFQTLVNEMIASKIQNKELAEFVESLKYKAAEDMLKVSLDERFCGSLNVFRRQSLPSTKY